MAGSSANAENDDAGGCAACLGLALVIALVIAGVISAAAIVDPFAWMPSVGQVWADCEGTDEQCDLAERFPGFWLHVVVNLAWALAAAVIAIGAFAAGVDAREARAARFDDEQALERWHESREVLAGVGAAGLLLAAIPIAVAVL